MFEQELKEKLRESSVVIEHTFIMDLMTCSDTLSSSFSDAFVEYRNDILEVLGVSEDVLSEYDGLFAEDDIMEFLRDKKREGSLVIAKVPTPHSFSFTDSGEVINYSCSWKSSTMLFAFEKTVHSALISLLAENKRLRYELEAAERNLFLARS